MVRSDESRVGLSLCFLRRCLFRSSPLVLKAQERRKKKKGGRRERSREGRKEYKVNLSKGEDEGEGGLPLDRRCMSVRWTLYVAEGRAWGIGEGSSSGGRWMFSIRNSPPTGAGAFYILASRSSRTLQTQGAAAIMPECTTIPAFSISRIFSLFSGLSLLLCLI